MFTWQSYDYLHMLNTHTYRLSLIASILLMVFMILFGTTAARAAESSSAQKGTAHYQLTEHYE